MVQTSDLKKIILIAGPTASGKTALSIQCAKELDGEIIGCDSMQIYKGLDIGTGKILPTEKQGIPHFMIDIIPPHAEFSVSDYANMCDKIINDISSRNRIPIIVGGTGLYISGLINGLDYAGASKSEEVRNKYNRLVSEKGKEYVYELLKDIDPQACEKINVNDTKRVIRALEIYELTGKTKSEAAGKNKVKRYNYKAMVLSPPRQLLYQNINLRVDSMIKQGLIDEVKKLFDYREYQSMQAIGYKEIISYLNGDCSIEEAIDSIKVNSRHYAKRQTTYFKNMDIEKEVYEDYTPKDNEKIIESLIKFIEE